MLLFFNGATLAVALAMTLEQEGKLVYMESRLKETHKVYLFSAGQRTSYLSQQHTGNPT